MDFNVFNQWKSEGYAKKTEEEYNQWKDDFKTWFRSREWTDWERNLVVEQIKKLDDTKKAWFDKQKNRPTITKTNYIFREEEGEKIIEFLDVLTKILKKKYLDE